MLLQGALCLRCCACRALTELVYVPGSTVASNQITGTVTLSPDVLYNLLLIVPAEEEYEALYEGGYLDVQLAYAAHPEGSSGVPVCT